MRADQDRSPGAKLLLALLVAALLSIPLFTVYLLVYDRQSQSETARRSIAAGWGGPQTIAGPVLVIPFQDQTSETVTEGGRQTTRIVPVWRELTLAPETAAIETSVAPERRRRSIYEAVVYAAHVSGEARFALPADLTRLGVAPERLAFDRAELRFGLADALGLYGPPPRVMIGGVARDLQPGKGPSETDGSGFFTWLDAETIRASPLVARFSYDFRGNGWLALDPQAGDTRWTVRSPWPSPSFQGGFLPVRSTVNARGFVAQYRIGNLALGRALASAEPAQSAQSPATAGVRHIATTLNDADNLEARIQLVTPVDLYSQVNRSVKYGFLFIGFTFLAFLLFDVIGGVRVSTIEYLLVGAGLVLFFVLLLAFAEVIGFTPAYLLAATAIIGLLTAYSAAVLGSRRRAVFILGLLVLLYAVLYILLSLEAFSLLIGSLLLFAALALVMFLTRNIDWGQRREELV